MSELLNGLPVSKARGQEDIYGTRARLQKKFGPLCIEFAKDRKASDQFEIWSASITQAIIKDAFAFVVKCQREQIEPDVIERLSDAMNGVIAELPKIINDSGFNNISRKRKK